MKLIKHVLSLLSATSLAVLLLVVLLVIFKLGTWASEMAQFLLAWTVMLGGALAYADHAHLGLDILVEKFDPVTRKYSMCISHFMVLVFALTVMLYGGAKLTYERFDMGQMIPSMDISKGWLYLSVPISGAFICIIAIANLYTLLTSTPEANL